MKAHFFEIDTLIKIDNSVWILSKDKPDKPLLKITQSEYNLLKRGIYKKYDSRLKIDGFDYWLPENLLNQLKIKCKTEKVDITSLSFSLREYIDRDLIDELDYRIYVEHFRHLKNKTDDIILFCSAKSKRSYEAVIRKIEKELNELGLQIKHIYYPSETFYNKNKDEISFKKIRLLLQHLIGLKTDEDKFTDQEVEKYDRVYYYDDNDRCIELAINSNEILSILINNTEDSNIKKMIKESIQESKYLITRKVTYNKVNLFIENSTKLIFSYINKTFEKFNIKK